MSVGDFGRSIREFIMKILSSPVFWGLVVFVTILILFSATPQVDPFMSRVENKEGLGR